MNITGAIRRINFFNKNSGFTIALFLLNDDSFKMVEDITFKKIIPVMGTFDRQPQIDEEFTLTGDFFNDRQYGIEFKITSFSRLEIQSEETIINYLSSDLFEGIGKVTAHKIVTTLGTDAITKIIKDQSCLEHLGLSRKQIEIITRGINKDRINQEAILFYLSGGFTMDLASKIVNQIGADITIIKANPYYLMNHIERLGFKKNDTFALNIGIKKESLVRMMALICYLLREMLQHTGNSFVMYEELIETTKKYYDLEDTLFSFDNFNQAIKDLEKNEQIIVKENPNKRIFDFRLYNQEIRLSLEISKLIAGTRGKIEHFSKELIERCYQDIMRNSPLKLSAKQEEAVKSAFLENIMIITGGPGTGKTTIVKEILALYQELLDDNKLFEQNVALLAPTGRAAKRLAESSDLPAFTIHRYLGYNGLHFEFDGENQKSEKLVIVDETSMMDLSLSYQLLISISNKARLIIVGDVDQLPSIGPGQILKDLIETNKIKVIKLDEIHRQANGSTIINLASDVNSGRVSNRVLQKTDDFSFIETHPANLLKNLIYVLNVSLTKGYDIQKDIQVLIPMYKGEIGIDNVNKVIQDLVNPLKDKSTKELKYMNKKYRINDKIIQLVNRPEYNIMNGDIGYIESFIEGEKEIEGVLAIFDGVKVEMDLEMIADISLAYAITIHKAQGSEFPIVIMPITSQHYIMLKRKLVYTAITRAKQKLVLLGSEEMLKMASSRIEVSRNTILKDEIIKLTSGKMIKKEDLDLKKDLTFSDDTPILIYDIPLEEEKTTIGEEEFSFDDFKEK